MNLNRLIMILEAELLNYEELLEFEQKKAKLIINSDTLALNDLLTREETHVRSLKGLDEQRQQFMFSWCELYGYDQAPSLLQIIESEDTVETQRISELRNQLLKISKQLDRQNQSNKTLTDQSINHVQQLFSILTGTNESLAYTQRGERADLGKKVLLDESV